MPGAFDTIDGVGLAGMATPLAEVTFVVLDLETTGGSPQSCAITEVGALKFRGGECLGTFQTLVNPGPDARLTPEIVYLTGITEAMIAPAPAIESVLPAFAEFIGDAVIVGHNVRFDLGFLRANLARHGYRALTNPFVDTYALARRLLRDEVPDYKLRTLARHFSTDADPCHRALEDARATAEVLHRLLERVASLGVTALDDLLALPSTSAHPQVAKLGWVAPIPRLPGVYLFRDVSGRVLFVGRAGDLRRRVRSYFSSRDRRKIGPLLREAHSLDHVVCVNELEAAVLEVRLIERHRPRYNPQVKSRRGYRYVRLTLDERFPRLAIVRTARPGDGCLYLGPVRTVAAAKLTVEAIETAVPLRRCTMKLSRSPAPGVAACPSAVPDAATCPCSGAIDEAAYSAVVGRVVEGLTSAPATLMEPLAARSRLLSSLHRSEEAAETRDRASSLARVVGRQRRLEALVLAGRVEVAIDGGGGAVIDRGRLVATWDAGGRPEVVAARLDDNSTASLPLTQDAFEEVACVAAWLEARAPKLRLVHAEHGWSWPAAKVAPIAAGATSDRAPRTVGQAAAVA